MATSDSPLNVPNVTLAVTRGNAGSPAGTITITGSGFGAAPNVVMWRNFDSETVGQTISAAPAAGEVGTFFTAEMQCVSLGNRKAGAAFTAGQKKILEFLAASKFTRFRHHVALAVPDGSSFPADVDPGPRTLPPGSNLKATWIMDGHRGDLAGSSDICLPTYNGQSQFDSGGNTINYSGTFRFANNTDDFWAWNEFNSFGWVQEADITNPKTAPAPLTLFMTSSKMGTNVRTKTDYPAFRSADKALTDANVGYDRVKYNSWLRESEGNAQVYYSDPYLALESSPGANDFVQCAFLGNAPVFSDCTQIRPVVADSWTDTEITIPNLFGLSHYHIIKPDGSIVSGAI